MTSIYPIASDDRDAWAGRGFSSAQDCGTDADTVTVPGITPARHDTSDRAQAWLRNAIISLAVLAAAAATVSWDAQYVLVRSVKRDAVIAALEAGVPDVGAVIFAALGIALALHGKRAIRARTLNVACIGISLAMNALASSPGWRDLAIWIMPSAVYALASDTLIGVVRAWVIARARHIGQALAEDEDEATPIAIIGGFLLWLLRLALAPLSTIGGFRGWVLDECPVAPGRKAPRAAPSGHPRGSPRPAVRRAGRVGPAALPAPSGHPRGSPRSAVRHAGKAERVTSPGPSGRPDRSPFRPRPAQRGGRPGKQARMIELARQRHDLTVLPLTQVSRVANTIGAEVNLSPGTARRVLLAHVRTLQNGHAQETAP